MATARLLEIATQVSLSLKVTVDRLPYTPEFDAAYAQFNELCGRTLPKDQVWWLLVDVRKRGLSRATRRRRPK